MKTCQIDGCEKAAPKYQKFCSMHRARIARHGSPDGKAPRKTIWERVEPKIHRSPGCWLWSGYHAPDGYAMIRTKESNYRVHRLAYENTVGPIPDGLVLDHACRNRACVNPDHLRPITQKQNVEHFTTDLKVTNTSGFRGVCWHPGRRRWYARVKHNDKVYGSYHETPEEAGEAARLLRLRLHTHNDLDHAA